MRIFRPGALVAILLVCACSRPPDDRQIESNAEAAVRTLLESPYLRSADASELHFYGEGFPASYRRRIVRVPQVDGSTKTIVEFEKQAMKHTVFYFRVMHVADNIYSVAQTLNDDVALPYYVNVRNGAVTRTPGL